MKYFPYTATIFRQYLEPETRTGLVMAEDGGEALQKAEEYYQITSPTYTAGPVTVVVVLNDLIE